MCTRFAAISQACLKRAVEAVRQAGGTGGCPALAQELGCARIELDDVSSPDTAGRPGDASSPDASRESASTPKPVAQEIYPGMTCAVILVRNGRLAVERMTFGYEASWLERPGRGGKLIANARLEDALARPGSMWAESLALRRCVVPAWGFYEPHRSRTTTSPRTGRPIKQQVFFALSRERSRQPGGASSAATADTQTSVSAPALFFAGIYQDGRFAIMTCAPNGSVAPVHDRMPVVLRPEEVRIWLGPRYATLVDRGDVPLTTRDA